MARREGPIVPVYVAPYPVEFLRSEVSLSVNTAAAGGNASLMAIG
jgi:RHH-type proline utilization regulon transcriptional repressor/proline dehydrogenase/delta 1-pyrroline-5-carboxylate dehydrogenase